MILTATEFNISVDDLPLTEIQEHAILNSPFAMLGFAYPQERLPRAEEAACVYLRHWVGAEFVGALLIEKPNDRIHDYHYLLLQRQRNLSKYFIELAMLYSELHHKIQTTHHVNKPELQYVGNFALKAGFVQVASGERNIYAVPPGWQPKRVSKVTVEFC